MRAFLTALDLDPKDNNLIKAAIDRLDEPDVDEDVSGFQLYYLITLVTNDT